MTPAQKVAQWDEEWRDLWVERVGILMDSGMRRDLADQTAFLWLSRARREREG